MLSWWRLLMSLTVENSVVWRHHFPATIACTDVGFAGKGIKQEKERWGGGGKGGLVSLL